MKSEKLTVEDIKLIGEGPQLKKVILEDSGSIEEFLKKYNIPLTVKSVQSYISKTIPHSEGFKVYMMGAMGKPYGELVKDRVEQLEDYIDSINDNIERYYDKKKDIKLINKLLELVNKEERYTHPLRAKLYRAKGMIYFFNNDITTALELVEPARSMAKDRMEHDLYVMCSADMATMYNYMERPYEATPFCLEGERFIDSDGVRDNTRYYFYRIFGNVIYSTFNFKRAIIKYEEALKYAWENMQIGNMYINIGVSYRNLGEFEKTLELFDKAFQTYDDNDKIGKSMVYNNKAQLFMQKGQLEHAVAYIILAIDLVKEISESYRISYTFTYIEIRLRKGEIEVIDELFRTLKSINKIFIYKLYIINGLNAIIAVCDSDIKLLQRLETRLFDYVKSLKETSNNITYMKEVDSCYVNVLRKLNKLQRKRRGV